MTTPDWVAVVVFGGIGLVWLGIALLGSLGVLLTRRLGSFQPLDAPEPVTIVIAARDEAERIGTTVDHLLAIRSPRVEIVIVDDRSSDETASIVEAKAESDPRLTLIRVTELPEGWLGKPHALHLGVASASTPWILFSDADTWIKPDALARALRAVTSSGRPIDHVSVLPGYDASSGWGIAGTLALYIHFLVRCAVVNLGLPLFPVGVGAFNLVRTDAYRAIGGHEALPFEVVDDVKLALLVQREWRKHGRGHSLVLSGPESVHIDWQADVRTVMALIEKNFFAMARFNALLASLLITSGLTALAGAVIAPVVAMVSPEPLVRIACWFAFVAWLGTGLPMAIVARQFGWSPLGGLISPLMAWVAPIALWRSARATLRAGGVRWRGRLYPLDELRRGQVW